MPQASGKGPPYPCGRTIMGPSRVPISSVEQGSHLHQHPINETPQAARASRPFIDDPSLPAPGWARARARSGAGESEGPGLLSSSSSNSGTLVAPPQPSGPHPCSTGCHLPSPRAAGAQAGEDMGSASHSCLCTSHALSTLLRAREGKAGGDGERKARRKRQGQGRAKAGPRQGGLAICWPGCPTLLPSPHPCSRLPVAQVRGAGTTRSSSLATSPSDLLTLPQKRCRCSHGQDSGPSRVTATRTIKNSFPTRQAAALAGNPTCR